MAFGRGKFTSKTDGMNRRKAAHLCLACRHSQPETFKACPKCGKKERVYFPSKAEFHRAAELLFLQDRGVISRLHFHPKFQLIVNDVYICTYVADAAYERDGELVTEDTKPRSFVDKSAAFKIKLFEAGWGRKLTIVN